MPAEYKASVQLLLFPVLFGYTWCSQYIQMLWFSSYFEVPPLWDTADFWRSVSLLINATFCSVFQKDLSKDLWLLSLMYCCFLTMSFSETSFYLVFYSICKVGGFKVVWLEKNDPLGWFAYYDTVKKWKMTFLFFWYHHPLHMHSFGCPQFAPLLLWPAQHQYL